MIALLARFTLVGFLNSIIGFSVIAVLDLGFDVRPALANALGFAVGASIGFFLTRGFVFRSRAGVTSAIGRYVLAIGCAFSANQLVLYGAGHVLGAGSVAHLSAQLLAVATYAIANFLLCHYWVFREGKAW